MRFAIKVLYVSVLMPLISCLSLRVTCPLYVCVCMCMRVCACVCYKCVQAHVREHARARPRCERVCISVCSRVSFFFFFFLISFFPLIIKVYFILQSVECAGNRQSVLFFSFLSLSLSLFPLSSSLTSSRSFFRVYAFHERISTINRVRGNEETFSDFFPRISNNRLRERWIHGIAMEFPECLRFSSILVIFSKSRFIFYSVIWNL